MITPFRPALYIILMSLFLAAGCVTPPQPPISHVDDSITRTDLNFQQGNDLNALSRDLTPYRGHALFLGVSTRLRERTAERDAAILHVAEQASRYVRFFAEYRYIVESTTGGIGYVDDISGTWDGDYADSLVDSVEIVWEAQDSSGTYILAYVPGLPQPPEIPESFASSSGRPTWIDSPPDIPGHIVGVGVTTPSRRVRDSLDRADQSALQQILLNAGTTVRMVEEVIDRNRRGTHAAVTSAQEASATLRGFYVIARHVSSDERYFHSLAIAREE